MDDWTDDQLLDDALMQQELTEYNRQLLRAREEERAESPLFTPDQELALRNFEESPWT